MNDYTEIYIIVTFTWLAYQNIYASEGNMTKGTDGKPIDAMSLEKN